MEDIQKQELRSIKTKVLKMLAEREKPTRTQPLDPSKDFDRASKYWSDFCGYFDYLLGMSEESFEKIRLHTYHLTGDNYQIYYFGESRTFYAEQKVDEISEGLPSAFLLNEPENGIGFKYSNGRYLSIDVMRYQRVVATLYNQGVFKPLLEAKVRPQLLEIGTGYGGMAHHVSRILSEQGKGATYYMVDLPETLLFAASYLTLHNPKKKIYVYDEGDFEEKLASGALFSYDFVLLPNFKIERLRKLKFDLVLNVASLQEMKRDQAESYLDFIQETCTGVFYSWNQDHQPKNQEISNLSDQLSNRFTLEEQRETIAPRERVLKVARKQLKKAAITLGLMNRPLIETPAHLPYREYIARPRNQHSCSTC